MPGLITSASGVPGLDLTVISAAMLNYLLLMIRIGAFVVTAPLLSARFIPLQIRIILVTSMTTGLFFTVETAPIFDLSGLGLVRIVLSEIFLGTSMGLVLTILFAAAVFAGDRIAATAGLSFAAQFDPANGGSTPVLAQIFGLAVLAIFVGENGHLEILSIVLQSYHMVPPGTQIPALPLIQAGLGAAGEMFLAASQIMLPIVGLLSLVNVVIGVITRSAPQLNLFSFGFPATMIATIVLLYLTAPTMVEALHGLVQMSITKLAAIVEELAYGRE